jgi:hypothetical protein
VRSFAHRRQLLFKADPRCHWCARRTYLKPGANKQLLATVDHLRTRISGRRSRDTGKTVLACHQCNQARNDAEQKGYHLTITPDPAGGPPTFTHVYAPELHETARAYAKRMNATNNAQYRARLRAKLGLDPLPPGAPDPLVAKFRLRRSGHSFPPDERYVTV